MMVFYIVSFYIFLLLGSGLAIRRYENAFREFWWPLRQKYEKRYVRPNKAILRVRKFFDLRKDNRIHWFICFLHYLQIASLFTPLLGISVFIFLPFETAEFVSVLLCLGPLALFVVCFLAFEVLQFFRCLIIKRTDPTCAHLRFHDRRDMR